MTWECDYPHSDATWPRSPEVLAGYLTDVPDDEVDRITHSNALRLYSFDMFKHLPKGELTVARFELRPTDVDLGFRSSERLRKAGTDTPSPFWPREGSPHLTSHELVQVTSHRLLISPPAVRAQ